MRFNNRCLRCCVFFFCLLRSSGQLGAQTLDALNKANLVTISALANATTPLADSVHAVPQFFFQIATLIDEQAQVVSRRAADNTLVNSTEKFSYVATGRFQQTNSFGILSYEIAITENYNVGRIALYGDLEHRLCACSLRWRKMKDGTHFSIKRLLSNYVKEETLRLDYDGGGCYEVAFDRKTALFLKWDKSGNIIKHQTE